jgi:phosphate acetyltransferase
LSSIMDKIKIEAKKNPKRIVLPEIEDKRILRAAAIVASEKIAIPVLIGDKDRIEKNAHKFGVDLDLAELVDPKKFNIEKYVSLYCKKRGVSERVAYSVLRKPLYFSCMMVEAGDAHGMVAGATYTSGEIIAATELIIGLQKGISVPSSFMLMDIPGFDGGEDGALIFADVAVNPDPSPECLCDIAMSSAISARNILRWEPKIAMLSFSTKGSASHPLVEKVVKATSLVKMKDPSLIIDGELQADAALVPAVSQRKIKGENILCGKANVLIFPNLDSANIGYKLVQWLAKAKAYGPVLQGFAKPVSDLSRGATVEDIIGTVAMISVQAQRMSK